MSSIDRHYIGDYGNPQAAAIIRTLAIITGTPEDAIAQKYMQELAAVKAQIVEKQILEEPKADTIARCKLRRAEALSRNDIAAATHLDKEIKRFEKEV